MSRDDRGGRSSFDDHRGRSNASDPPSRNRPTDGNYGQKPQKRRFKPPTPPNLDPSQLQEEIRLNKYVARSTRYSRKESDELVKRGRVTVNGEPTSPGMMVQPGDVVLLDEKPISRRDHLVYILINKPRGVRAEMDAKPTPGADDTAPDGAALPEQVEEANVWEEDDDAAKHGTLTGVLKFDGTEQLQVVHALAPEMMGLQLVSNDPALAKHFAEHPPKATYTLEFAEPLDPERLGVFEFVEGNQEGILAAELVNEDNTKLSLVTRGGFPAEVLAQAGITYERVDRLHFAGLTKKDLPRGHWRFLGEREITWVTMFQQ